MYVYDGDGNLVKSIIGEIVTYYPNSSYELRVEGESETIAKYYFAGATRIAMRENEAITWLLADHLGSTNVIADASGTLLTTLKYTAFGEIRTGSSLTDYQYTGQRNESEIGLYYYVARYYDPELGRFISADTIIPEPGSSQAYDRYAYANNNPINNNDPSGHRYCDDYYGRGCNVVNPPSGGGGGGGSSTYVEEHTLYYYSTPVPTYTLTPMQLLPTLSWNEIAKPTPTRVPQIKAPEWTRKNLIYEEQKMKNNHANLIGIGFGGNASNNENSGSIDLLFGGTNAVYINGSYGTAIGASLNLAVYIGEVYNIDSAEDYIDIDSIKGVTVSLGLVGITGGYGKASYSGGPELLYLGLAPGLGASYWESYTLNTWYWEFGGSR